jgi:preprotein translocase subunit YajC
MDFTLVMAQAAPAAGGGGFDLIMTVAPILMVLPIWYFLVIKPQQAKVQEHKDRISSVKRGDTVVTSGGIIGKVIRVVDDNELQVEISDGVRVRLVRQMISEVRSRSETTSKDAA